MNHVDSAHRQHDRYFRYAFGTPEAGRELVSLTMPHELIGSFRITSVEAGGITLVDDDLGEQRLDLLVMLEHPEGRRTIVYFLFEHKAHPDSDVLFQLFHYTGAIWRQCRANGTVNPDGKLPNIIPVVVYHGSGRWRAPTRLQDAVSPIGRMDPVGNDHRFSYILFDLHRMPANAITGGARVRSALLALKYAAERLTHSGVRLLLDALGADDPGTEFRRTTLRYLLEHREQSEAEIVFAEIRRSEYTHLREDAVTIAEALEKRGHEKGWIEGRAEALIDSFQAKFGDITDQERLAIMGTRDEQKLRAAQIELIRQDSAKVDVLDKLK